MKKKQQLKLLLKAILIEALKFSTWKVKLILFVYDYVFWPLVAPFIREHFVHKEMLADVVKNKNFHSKINKLAKHTNLKKAMKEQWEMRKDENNN